MARFTIGMVNGSLLDIYEEQWLGSVDRARAVGADLIAFIGRQLGDASLLYVHASEIYDLVAPERVDGLVVWAAGGGLYPERLERLGRRFSHAPVVSVEGELPGAVTLLMDDRQGMRDAVAHLIEAHGHRRIGFIRGPEHHAGAERRYDGYREALDAHGLPFDKALVAQVPVWAVEESTRAAARLLAEGVDAIAATNDDLAAGVFAAIEAAGMDVPADVGVVGFDDRIRAAGALHNAFIVDMTLGTPNLGSAMVPLTTVHAPFYELGARAVDLVLAQLRGEDVPPVVTLPVDLVRRRSCGCLPRPESLATDSGIEAALRSTVVHAAPVLDSDWPERLLAAFGAGADTFLGALSGLARASLRAGEPLESWLRALALLRGARSAPSELWLSAELAVRDVAEQAALARSLLLDMRTTVVRESGQRLVSAPDGAALTDALAAELPRLGIPSVHVAAYTDETRESARVTAAYPAAPALGAKEPFRANILVPEPALERAEPLSAVVMPLRFGRDELGYVVFEAGPRLGWVYELLQESLSEGAELRRRADAIRESERSLAAEARSRHELELKLMDAHRLESLGVLAGGIAHDFNNILQAIIGNADLARSSVQPGSTLDVLLEQIDVASERAANLVQQMLAYSGSGRFMVQPLELEPLVREACLLVARTQPQVSVTCSCAPGLPSISADAQRVRQLVISLLMNAAEAFDGDPGEIAVELQALHGDRRVLAGFEYGDDCTEGTYVMLSVRDDGAGMDDETRSRAFEPFFTTKFTGRGLGLPAVLGITRSHRGALRVTTAPGAGSTFEVLLPAL